MAIHRILEVEVEEEVTASSVEIQAILSATARNFQTANHNARMRATPAVRPVTSVATATSPAAAVVAVAVDSVAAVGEVLAVEPVEDGVTGAGRMVISLAIAKKKKRSVTTAGRQAISEANAQNPNRSRARIEM